MSRDGIFCHETRYLATFIPEVPPGNPFPSAWFGRDSVKCSSRKEIIVLSLSPWISFKRVAWTCRRVSKNSIQLDGTRYVNRAHLRYPKPCECRPTRKQSLSHLENSVSVWHSRDLLQKTVDLKTSNGTKNRTFMMSIFDFQGEFWRI